MAQLRDVIPEIRKAGAELVIIGNGAEHFARAFREDFALDGPLLVDPELVAYRAAGLRRGRAEALSPLLAGAAWRALRSGSRQTGVEGDPWQLGGAFVIQAGGRLTYQHVAEHAGDQVDPDHLLDALDPEAPTVDEVGAPSPMWQLAGEAASLLLDPTIVFSFDRTGYWVHSLTFNPDDLDVDLHGRRCLVTGANSGIGFETALALADLGARVTLLCRSLVRGEEAAQRIRQQTGSQQVEVMQLDLSDLDQVAEVGAVLAQQPVDVLIHNAGVLPEERVLTPQGLEQTFATHVAGPHLLTLCLAAALSESTSGRVVWVTSGGLYTQRLDTTDLDWSERPYDGVRAYAQTKRMQLVMAELWAEVLGSDHVAVNAMHPGWADTPAVRESLPRFHAITESILRTPAEGADTVVWLAASDAGAALTGQFVFDRKPRRTVLLPGTASPEGEAGKLWQMCDDLARPYFARNRAASEPDASTEDASTEDARTEDARENDA